ncbi:MAG: hypothetical protein ABSA71_18580 [Desulfomonilia bacterium]|jgi:hypothetical protein
MNTNGINGNDSSMSLYLLYGMMPVNQIAPSDTATSQATATDAVGSSQSDSVNVSQASQLFSQLQQLQQSDPDKFKQVMTNIAGELQSAAQGKSGFEAQTLSDLATKFQNVANGGDISQLMPPTQSSSDQYTQQGSVSAKHHHGHHHGTSGAQNDIKQVMSNVIDELNKAVSGDTSTS